MDYIYFPFFVTDWMTGCAVREMTYFEKGLYIDMLAYQWKEGKIPADTKRFRKIFKLSPYEYKNKIHKVLKKFPVKNNYRLNKKLKKLRKNYTTGYGTKAKKEAKAKNKNLTEVGKQKQPKTKPRPKTILKDSLIPKPDSINPLHLSQDPGEGIRHLPKEAATAIRQAVHAHRAACGQGVGDASDEVKRLLEAVLMVPQMANNPQQTLAYILQSRRQKNKKSDVGSMVAVLVAFFDGVNQP